MKKITISGFGGQGVLSLGKFISYSAMFQDLNTSWLPSYGPEMRGGTSNCSVIYSKEPIAAPVIDHPDYLLAFNDPSLKKFEDSVIPGGTILINSDIVTLDVQRKDVTVYKIPVDTLAQQINPRGGNIIMLGILLELFGDIEEKYARQAIEHVFENKPKVIPMNFDCLQKGREYMRNLKK